MLPSFETDHRNGLHNGAPATSCALCNAEPATGENDRYEIIVTASGDRATAGTSEAALVAADTLCRDHAGRLGTRTALSHARTTVIITEDGTYMGILTELARQGRRAPAEAPAC